MISFRALCRGINPFHSRTRLLVFLLCLLALCFSGAQLWASYQFSEAAKAIKEMKLEAAQRQISNCLLIWPTSVKAKLLAARIERLAGRFEEAEDLLAECKALGGQLSTSVQLEYLLIRAQRGELDQFAPFFFQCVKEGHPDSALILETMAMLTMGFDRFHDAVVCVEKWIELEPDNMRAHDLRGQLRELMGNSDGAIAEYERVLEAEPNRFLTRLRLAGVYLDLRKAEEAARHAEYLTKHYSARPEGWVLLARSYYDKGKYTEAATLIEETLQEHPEDGDALLWGGILSFRLDRYAEAAQRLEKATGLIRNHRIAIDYWYRSLSRLGDPRKEAVLARLQKLRDGQTRLEELQIKDITSGPLAIVEQLEVARLLLDLDMNRQGVHWLTRVLREDPSNGEAHRLLAEYHRKRKETVSADYHQKIVDSARAPAGKP